MNEAISQDREGCQDSAELAANSFVGELDSGEHDILS